MKDTASHYDRLARLRDQYYQKNRYYHDLVYKQYRYFIPEGRKVLEVGCSTGELLNAVKPSLGVGLDISEEVIKLARAKHPHLEFHCTTAEQHISREKFDFIILSGVLGEADDIQKLLEALRPLCTADTRIIIEYYSYVWQYILKFAEAFSLKIPQRIQNWITAKDLHNFLTLSGYEKITSVRSVLLPLNIWGLSYIINRFIAKLPVINALTLNHFIIARCLFDAPGDCSVSILIPCKNEKGNIEPAVTRTPAFGTAQEFIFVEGGSKDGTCEEIERVIKACPDKNIKLIRQSGKGKGDAVRTGFAQASGDVLMILDADLTTPPEDMPKFYDALVHNKGEFINGCRLVYPMEKQAMRFLNLAANKFFGMFFSWLLGQTFRDTLCGTKVLYRRHYEQIVTNRDYFGDFDPFGDFDLIFGATKLNLKVIELPVRYKSRMYGSTQIQRFRHGLLLFQMCFFAMRKIKFL